MFTLLYFNNPAGSSLGKKRLLSSDYFHLPGLIHTTLDQWERVSFWAWVSLQKATQIHIFTFVSGRSLTLWFVWIVPSFLSGIAVHIGGFCMLCCWVSHCCLSSQVCPCLCEVEGPGSYAGFRPSLGSATPGHVVSTYYIWVG